MPATYVDGHMVFETNHFSDYVIVYEEVAEAEVEAEAEESVTVEVTEEVEEEAGKAFSWWYLLAIPVVAVVAIICFRRKDEEGL